MSIPILLVSLVLVSISRIMILVGLSHSISYEVCYTINFPGSRVSDFSGNLRTRKLNKAHKMWANIPGIQYFCGIWSFSCINRSGVKFILYFILSLFYFLTICANFPFSPHLRLSNITLLPFLIACLFHRAEHRRCRRQRCQSFTWYASFVGRSLAGDRGQRHFLGTTIDVPSGVRHRCEFLITP